MRLRYFLFLLLPLAALLLPSSFEVARASVNENIRGLASSSQGYISFNCLDDDFAGRFPFTFTFQFNVPPCSFSQHGVNLNFDNTFSGLAWNSSLGFIDFGSSTTPPAPNYDFNVNCQNPCNAGNNCIACYNDENERVFGWAYVIGTDDWIELNSAIMPETTITNYLAPQPGIFSGYASSSFGAIMFNCANNGSCGTFDHKVYIWKLDLKEMSAPNWSFSDACSQGARRATFKWLRRGGIQTAYRVVLSTTNSTSSPAYDSGQIAGSASQLVCPGPSCSFQPAYGTSYYWWLQLWDENGQPSELFQFDTNTFGVLTDNIAANSINNPTNPNLTFTNYKHEFPTPYFSWSPTDIIVGSSTDFVSNSHYYTAASPGSNPQLCVDGICQFLWQISDGAGDISNATQSTTTIVFWNNNPKSVSLQIIDPDLYTCSTSSPVLTINFQLPIWKEVKAE
ncbi:MAG: hypothetical protein PHG95_03600 [Patescibacteria group bacterium]|nr:hypothetical protein [Patescibacteria group bacterium]